MRKMRIVKQHDLKDCGVCSLKSILQFYGGDISLERLRMDTHTTQDGTTAFHLIEASKRYGFDSYGVKADSLFSEDIKLPAIAHVTTKKGLNHYVVIYEITKGKVHLMDPACGKVVMMINEFESIWNHVLLLFYPKRKIIFIPKDNSLWQVFIKIFFLQKKLFMGMIVTSVLLTILTIIHSYYFKVALDLIGNYKEMQYLKVIILTFAFVLLLKLLLNFYRKNLEVHLNKNIDVLLYKDFFHHLFYLPLEVITSRSSGEITSRVHEMENLKSLFTEIIITCCLDLLLMFISIPILYSLNHYLFFVLLFMMMIYFVIGLIYSKSIYKKVYSNIEEEADFNGSLIEQIRLIHTTKNLNQTSKMLKRVEKIHSKYLKNTFDLTKFINNEENIKLWIYEIGLFLINTIGFLLIFKEKLSITELVTFNTLIVYFLDPIKNVIDSLPKYNFIKASFTKINEFLGIPIENLGSIEKIQENSIYFKNVSFSYDRYHPVLKNCSFNLSSCDFALLKGNSGCGKSTICKILEKYYMDFQGEVFLGNINIKDLSIGSIRENITYVSQKECLFTASIKENILMDRSINMEVFNEVCKICKIDAIVDKKPARYETIISEESTFISGGERQRIILARALLKESSIYLIDEALSEVDSHTEMEIIKALQKYLKGKTVLYITHKNQDHLFDKIITLEDKHGL